MRVDKRFLERMKFHERKAKKAEPEEKKEEFVSKRAELLARIKEKEQRREENPKVETPKKEKREEQKVTQVQKEVKKAEVKVDLSRPEREKHKSARDVNQEKIKELEDKISSTKYNKSTQGAIGLMKAQLAALKQKASGGQSSHTSGYSVKKSGDGTVVLLGFPSSGKSTLLNSLTNANSEVAAYAFTTLTVIPGMLDYKQSKIQILDVPGIVEGAAAGTGRGKEVLQVIRTADLILMILDAQKPEQKVALEKEIYDSQIRVNQRRPDVKLKKTIKGGIRVGRTVETPDLDDDTIKSIANSFKIINADILLREAITADQFIDIIEGNKVYIPTLVVLNKVDLLNPSQLRQLQERLTPDMAISGQQRSHLAELKEAIYQKLNFIRIYMKEPNKKPDLDEPMIMINGATLQTLCDKLHRDFSMKFKFARIWGKSVRFEGQKLLKLSHQLKDGDVVELHIG